MDSLTHVRPCVHGAGGRVAPARALVDVCVSVETEGQDSHAFARFVWLVSVFFFFLFFCSEHLPPFTRTC